MQGRLYVVATPLGNLEDLTLRAQRVLGEVALILCEDTRRTAKLLKSNKINTTTLSFHEHNAKRRTPQVLRHLSAGDELALVSDAGTPTISDPGTALVMTVRRAGHAVIPIPGPSAVATALSVSGLPADRYLFRGFLPARGRAATCPRRAGRRCGDPRLLRVSATHQGDPDGPGADSGRQERVPLPRGHEATRGIRRRDARGAGRVVRRAEGEGRDHIGRRWSLGRAAPDRCLGRAGIRGAPGPGADASSRRERDGAPNRGQRAGDLQENASEWRGPGLQLRHAAGRARQA